MPNNPPSTISRATTYFMGALFLGLGLITLIHPQIMTRYGLPTDTTHAVMSIRALIAGAELGLGTLMLLGGRVGISIRSRLWTALFVFGGIILARVTAMLIAEETIPQMIIRELIAEIIIVGIISFGLNKAR